MLKYHRESEVVPEGDPQNKQNARFGSSVACLGAPDTSDDTFLVVVGAPYFK